MDSKITIAAKKISMKNCFAIIREARPDEKGGFPTEARDIFGPDFFINK